MSRITKQIAEDVTKSLLSKKYKEHESIEFEYKGLIENHILSTTPKKILEIFSDSSLKGYLNKDYSIYVTGPGLKGTYINLKNDVPIIGGGQELPTDIAHKVEQLIQKSEKKNVEIRELRNEISASLLALGTFKRVQEQFPEAAEFLPKTSTPTSLVVNIDKLRTKINS